MKFKENETWGDIIVTDQGNGTVICGKCRTDLGRTIGSCPKCKRKIVHYTHPWFPVGGSDY